MIVPSIDLSAHRRVKGLMGIKKRIRWYCLSSLIGQLSIGLVNDQRSCCQDCIVFLSLTRGILHFSGNPSSIFLLRLRKFNNSCVLPYYVVNICHKFRYNAVHYNLNVACHYQP